MRTRRNSEKLSCDCCDHGGERTDRIGAGGRAAGGRGAVVRMVRRPASSPDEVSWDPADAGWMSTRWQRPPECRGPSGRRRCRGSPVDRLVQGRDPRLPGRRNCRHRGRRRRAARSGRPRLRIRDRLLRRHGIRGGHRSPPTGRFIPGRCLCPMGSRRRAAEEAGVRVAYARTGLVVSPGGVRSDGWCLSSRPAWGRIGPGDQWWSFIS